MVGNSNSSPVRCSVSWVGERASRGEEERRGDCCYLLLLLSALEDPPICLRAHLCDGSLIH